MTEEPKLNGIDYHAKYKRPESVLVVVYTRTGKVLLLRRVDHSEFWQSVTGSLEWNDKGLAETARRELYEETGLVAGSALRDWGRSNRYQILPQWSYKYAPGITENLEHVFSLELPLEVPVTLNPKEHSEYRWLDFTQAAAKAASATNREAILKLAQECMSG